MVLPKAPVNLVGDLAAQGSNGFCLGVAHGQATSNVVRGRSPESHLCDGDAVKSDVELTVATAVEAVPLLIPKPHRNLRCALVHRLGRARAEATHIGGPFNPPCHPPPRPTPPTQQTPRPLRSPRLHAAPP